MKKVWFLENCRIEAEKYKTRIEFQKNSPSAYQAAFKNKWLNDICSHMLYLCFPWTKEDILEETKKHKTISEFQKKCSGGYKAAVRFGILYEACSHMPKISLSAQQKPKVIAIVVNELKEIHGDLVKIKEETYFGVKKRAIFIDKDYGEWQTTVYGVLQGGSHPKRSVNKVKNTCQKKYGTFHPLQNKEIREKADLTNLQKFGVKNVSSNKDIQEKKKNTTLKNFGCEYPSQNQDIGLRTAKASNITTLKTHWKTAEKLVCQASYEAKAVDYLNTNKINFIWQPETFKMPNGKTYRPDLFLVDTQTWVEIKGYMRPKNKEKWDWFKTQFPTAELWDKAFLKKINVLK